MLKVEQVNMFVKVAESETDEAIEIPVESQGHLLMSTLSAQFPCACGLKFKTEQGLWRGVRVVDDKLYAPNETWDDNVYIVSFPKDSKRKGGDDLEINSAKNRKIERKCVDLIVLGIPWKSTEDVVRNYFDQFGEVVLCEIKRDGSGNSKGFGFVRYKEYSSQVAVLAKKHMIDGRWCDVKVPNSQEPEASRKIFVGRLSDAITTKDLHDYFGQYGQVIDVYIPKPFRAFGFVTFVEADIAQGLCGESHIIKGCSVHVSKADPKDEDGKQMGGGMAGGLGAGIGGGPMGYHHPHQMSGGHPGAMINPSIRRSASQGMHSNGSHVDSMAPKMVPPFGPMGSRTKKFEDSGFDSSRPPHENMRSANVNSEQMSQMMNMFNPMMAAFIQQLASGMQQPPAGMDANGVGNLQVAADYSMMNSQGPAAAGMSASMSTYNANGSRYGLTGQHPNSRFKQ